VSDIELPRRFFNARNISFKRFFTETNAAEVEITHKTARATTLEATPNNPRLKLGRALRFYDH
jgi:hypothetical protein